LGIGRHLDTEEIERFEASGKVLSGESGTEEQKAEGQDEEGT
jgi:hypothetical protein